MQINEYQIVNSFIVQIFFFIIISLNPHIFHLPHLYENLKIVIILKHFEK